MAANPRYLSRRRFAMTALSAGAALLSLNKLSAQDTETLLGEADGTDVAAPNRGTGMSFASLKQIDAGLLNVGYAEAGPANGAPVLLLHGWPYDIHSFVDVATLLAEKASESSSRICAVLVQLAFLRVTPSAMASSRWLPLTPSL
jgi:hypothetical protein